MNPPCIAAVWYLVPAVSSSLAKELAKTGLSQAQIAEKLGLTRAAVSQYLSGKRGTELKLGRQSRRKIKELAARLAKSETSDAELSLGMCGICITARREKALCGLHKKAGAPKGCSICYGACA